MLENCLFCFLIRYHATAVYRYPRVDGGCKSCRCGCFGGSAEGKERFFIVVESGEAGGKFAFQRQVCRRAVRESYCAVQRLLRAFDYTQQAHRGCPFSGIFARGLLCECQPDGRSRAVLAVRHVVASGNTRKRGGHGGYALCRTAHRLYYKREFTHLLAHGNGKAVFRVLFYLYAEYTAVKPVGYARPIVRRSCRAADADIAGCPVIGVERVAARHEILFKRVLRFCYLFAVFSGFQGVSLGWWSHNAGRRPVRRYRYLPLVGVRGFVYRVFYVACG